MTRLTIGQLDVLERIVESRASGVCIRYEWVYTIGGENVTRYVRALDEKGLVDITTFTAGRAAVNATDAGRRLVEQERAS